MSCGVDIVMEKVRVLIVDDHPIVCRGLTAILNEEDDLTVCGVADNAESARQRILELKPDVVLLDLSLKGTNGIELIKNLRVQLPDLPVLVISQHDESLFATRVLRAGGKGYIMKEEAPEIVLEAIRRVLDGKIYVSNRIKDRIVEFAFPIPPTGRIEQTRSPLHRLSDRELEVFKLIGLCLKTSEIAKHLHLAVKTIEAYKSNIKEKLGLKNSLELHKMAFAYHLGCLGNDDQGSADDDGTKSN